ncbi:PAS domain S-box protein [Natrialba swarupiae]|nr:PAS domain S-box protein [Natrialba swarupiae]
MLFDQAPDGIVVHDVTGAVLDVNETLAEMLGYSRAELLEMDVSDFVTGAEDEALQERWAAMTPGSSHKAEVDGRHRRADGSTYPVEVWVSRLHREDGDDRFVAFIRDITDRNQRIRQLRVLDRVLRHNLNNEMSIIRGYAQTIERTGGELAENARQITAGSDQLLETVAKQREIVQILSKPPEYLEVDIVEITQQILGSIRAEYPDARIGYEGQTVVSSKRRRRSSSRSKNSSSTHSLTTIVPRLRSLSKSSGRRRPSPSGSPTTAPVFQKRNDAY